MKTWRKEIKKKESEIKFAVGAFLLTFPLYAGMQIVFSYKVVKVLEQA